MLSFLHPATFRVSRDSLFRYVSEQTVNGGSKSTYFEALGRVQLYQVAVPRSIGRPELPLIGRELDQTAFRLMGEELDFQAGHLDLAWGTDPEHLLKECVTLISEFHPELLIALEELVARLYLIPGKRAGGASASDAMGAILIRPSRGWQIFDFAECLLHELTHQAQFLDEMVNGYYSVGLDSLKDPKHCVLSSQRGCDRPYDLAFSAACVSATLLEFYEFLGRSDKATRICTCLTASISELLAASHLLTQHGLRILREIDGVARSSAIGRASPDSSALHTEKEVGTT